MGASLALDRGRAPRAVCRAHRRRPTESAVTCSHWNAHGMTASRALLTNCKPQSFPNQLRRTVARPREVPASEGRKRPAAAREVPLLEERTSLAPAYL